MNNNNNGKNHKWNLIALENSALDAYYNWEKNNTETTRTTLFLAINDLAYAILNVGGYIRTVENLEELAYEYALYLFERILTGNLKLHAKTKFPLQFYISKNIKHIIKQKRNNNWQDLIIDLESLLKSKNDEEIIGKSTDNQFDKFYLANQLLDALKLFYDNSDIERILPIAINMIYDRAYYYIPSSYPTDIQDFCITLIALSKHFTHKNEIHPKVISSKEALEYAIKNTVFLASIVNSKFFPRELLLSCDIDSLYRLVAILGGKRIRIPNQKELDTLIGVTSAISDMILNGKDKRDALMAAKKKFKLCFSGRINLDRFLSNVIKCMNMFDEHAPSYPIIDIITDRIKELGKNLDVSNLDSQYSINKYCELTEYFVKLTENLTKLNAEHCY